ncbi:MAG: YciI family protein [Solirubrobacteraceae bacterium]
MKYMLQVRFNGADLAISKLPSDEQQAISAEFEAIGRLEGVLDGNQLQPLSTATTVRVDTSQPQVSAGSDIEPASALDGYYLYEAPDINAAIALAARIPATRWGASVEVRPVVER